MKIMYFVFCLVFFWIVNPIRHVQAQEKVHRCGTVQLDSIRKAKDPSYRERREQFEKQLREFSKQARISRMLDEVLSIPVVVHVVYTFDKKTNIPDSEIYDQIRILNEDFRRMPDTPGFNTHPSGTDMNIEFRLASIDPLGNPTNGITRHPASQDKYDVGDPDGKDMEELANIVSWPAECYLNIWVTDLSVNYLGYARFPEGTGLEGLDGTFGSARTDGVYIDYKNFGTGMFSQDARYKGGRTTTHEVGHWLGLLHTFMDSCGTDYVDDTPTVESDNDRSTVDCSEVYSSCTGVLTRNMIENYMDYSPDPCMNIFTQGQKQRVARALQVSPRRKLLAECSRKGLPTTETLEVKAYSKGMRTITLETEFKGIQNIQVDIFNHLGQKLQSATYRQIPYRLWTDYGSFSSGVYIIRIQTNTEYKVTKVVVW